MTLSANTFFLHMKEVDSSHFAAIKVQPESIPRGFFLSSREQSFTVNF